MFIFYPVNVWVMKRGTEGKENMLAEKTKSQAPFLLRMNE